MKFTFYHGTSEQEWERMQHSGKFDLKRNFGRWLAASGVYLFCNNPVLAYRFANYNSSEVKSLGIMTSTGSKTSSVVLKVELKPVSSKCILDLTSAKGMEQFYVYHYSLSSTLNRNIPVAFNGYLNDDVKFRPYYASVISKALSLLFPPTNALSHQKISSLISEFLQNFGIQEGKELEDFCHSLQKHHDNRGNCVFNFDCAVITWLVIKNHYRLVIAAIQEGKSLNSRFHDFKPEWKGILGFEGIRLRDHLEVCITDQSLIDWPPKRIDLDPGSFDSNFWQEVTLFHE